MPVLQEKILATIRGIVPCDTDATDLGIQNWWHCKKGEHPCPIHEKLMRAILEMIP